MVTGIGLERAPWLALDARPLPGRERTEHLRMRDVHSRWHRRTLAIYGIVMSVLGVCFFPARFVLPAFIAVAFTAVRRPPMVAALAPAHMAKRMTEGSFGDGW